MEIGKKVKRIPSEVAKEFRDRLDGVVPDIEKIEIAPQVF